MQKAVEGNGPYLKSKFKETLVLLKLTRISDNYGSIVRASRPRRAARQHGSSEGFALPKTPSLLWVRLNRRPFRAGTRLATSLLFNRGGLPAARRSSGIFRHLGDHLVGFCIGQGKFWEQIFQRGDRRTTVIEPLPEKLAGKLHRRPIEPLGPFIEIRFLLCGQQCGLHFLVFPQLPHFKTICPDQSRPQ